MKSFYWILIAIAAVVFLSGCQAPKMEKPLVTVDDIDAKGITVTPGKGATMDLTVRVIVSNPNPVGAHLTKVVYDVYLVNGKEKYLGHGEKHDIDIRKQGDTAIEIPTTLEFDFATLDKMLQSLQERGSIKLKVSGSAYLDLKATTFEIPFERIKIIALPAPTPTATPTATPTSTPTVTPTATPTETTPEETETPVERLNVLITPRPAEVGEVVTVTVVTGTGEPVSSAYVGYIDAVKLAGGLTVAYLEANPLIAVKVVKESGEIVGTTDENGKIQITFNKASEYVIVGWKGVGTGGAKSLLVKPGII